MKMCVYRLLDELIREQLPRLARAGKASKMLTAIVLIVIVASSTNIPAMAMPPYTNDWPKFQGNLKNTGVAYPNLGGIFTPTALWTFATDNAIGPGSPVIADIDGDGQLDVLVGTANFASTGGIYALQGVTGALKWKYGTGDYGTYATPPVADIDGDGKLETVFVSYAGKIITLEDDGTEKWKLDKGSAGTHSVIVDIDGDGFLEIVAGAAGKIWLLKADGTGVWSKNFIVGTNPAVADVDGDGGLEIVFAALGTKTVVALNADGSTQWTSPSAGQDFQMSLSIADDLNGDGKPDVVVGCRDNKVYAYSGVDGSQLWSYLTVGRVFGIAVADMDADGIDDVVATATKGNGLESYVYVLNGNTGTLQWQHNIVGKRGYTTEGTPAVVDVNKDGVLDVVVGSTDMNLYVLSGTDGSEIWKFPLGNPSSSSPAIADINGDGVMDIVIRAGSTVYAVSTSVLRVEIDIKPGSDPNSVNLKDQGLLPVAVLGSAMFDVTAIDETTLQLGGVIITTRGKAAKTAFSIEDVNGDGYPDLVAFFRVQDLVAAGALDATTTTLTLTGSLRDGTPIAGSDSVRVVPP